MNEREVAKEIRVLLFSLMGVRFAMDMSQIFEMRPLGKIKKDVALFHLHEKLDFRRRIESYKSPMALMVRDDVLKQGIVIEYPEDMDIHINLTDIHPLPHLLESLNPEAPVWAVFIMEGEPVLLVDAYRLLGCNR